MGTNVFLTQNELYKLRLMCANPFLELGSTMQPEHLACVTGHSVSRSSTVLVRFPDAEYARKWNDAQETRIRTGGHIATVALSFALGYVGGIVGAKLAVGLSAASGIAKDELQTLIWYPKMSKDWVLKRVYNFRLEQHPGKRLSMSWVDIVMDEKGVEKDCHSYATHSFNVGGESGLPMEVVVDMLKRLPSYGTITFQ